MRSQQFCPFWDTESLIGTPDSRIADENTLPDQSELCIGVHTENRGETQAKSQQDGLVAFEKDEQQGQLLRNVFPNEGKIEMV